MRALCLALALGAGLAAPFAAAAPAVAADLEIAEAADAKLADFSGPWVGSTGPNAEIVRNATLLIEMRKGDAFAITWTSFEADPDKPNTPVTERKRTMAFEPSKRPGLWRGTGTNDPVAIRAAWAHIKGRTLTINVIAVLADGGLERQIYERTLTAKGLKLTYRRVLDGKVAKTIEAEFLKL
jgi:hypothetical protein